MTRGERDDTLPRFDRLQVAWEDDAWLGATASCCAASFCIFVLLTVFLAEGTLHKNERVNCITVWEHNTTARSYLEDVVPDVFGLNGTEPWEVRLKDTLMFGGRTRLRCILGWTILGCLLAAGLFFFSFNLFARRVRVAYLARQYRSQGGPAPAAQPITCLPWYPLLPSPHIARAWFRTPWFLLLCNKHRDLHHPFLPGRADSACLAARLLGLRTLAHTSARSVSYHIFYSFERVHRYCIYSRWLIGRPLLAILTLIPTLDYLSDIAITVQWARGQHMVRDERERERERDRERERERVQAVCSFSYKS